jgi:hypothetical protein
LRNPFYVLILVVGTVFAVSACAYGVLAVRTLHAVSSDDSLVRAQPLRDVQWLQEHGDALLVVELAILAVLTFAAIGTDGWWDKGEENDRGR